MRKALPWIAIVAVWIIGITVFVFVGDQTPRYTLTPESEQALHIRQLIQSGRLRVVGVEATMRFRPHCESQSASTYRLPPVPATWDCDDLALFTYNFLIDDYGFNEEDVRILLGNLHIEGEEISECNHVWIICYGRTNEGGPYWMAFDWGGLYCDEQHYEGWPITYEELLQAVEYDVAE